MNPAVPQSQRSQRPPASVYETDLARWRAQQELELSDANGWLAVVGLQWLKEGVQPLAAPVESLGSLKRTGDRVEWLAADGAPGRVLRPDNQPPKDLVSLGTIQLQLLRRGKRLGIRIWDAQSDALKRFRGRQWYPADPKLRVPAQFHPYPKGRTLTIVNVLGDTEKVPCPGWVEFRIGRTRCRMDAWQTKNGLFFVFADRTNGKGTYSAGRFLEADEPTAGVVSLDFNRAVSPPCAFTDFATCPLPPRCNRLPVSIPAGERHRGHHG